MAFSVTYTFSNGTTSDATQVNTNFTDVINATSDGTEDFSIGSLIVAGATTLNGNVTFGNGSVDDVNFTGSLASSIRVKTTYSYDIGSSTVGLRSVYLGSANSVARTVRVIAPTVPSSYTLTLPTTGGTVGYAAESLDGSGTLAFGLKMMIGETHNIGLAADTTSETNDSIKIQGALAALSSTNPGYLCLPDATSGLAKVFKITADVPIDLTGAHWGEGTKGDLTDYMLSVYAINDAGTLKYGVASIPNHNKILNTDDTATASSVTTVEKVLVNSSLTGDSGCIEIGWVKANFDDTEGAAEDLWSVQTGLLDINLGKRPEIPQYFTPSGSMSTNTTYTGYWSRRGAIASMIIKAEFSGAPNSTGLTINVISGLAIDSGLMPSRASGEGLQGGCTLRDSGADTFFGRLTYSSTTVFGCSVMISSGAYTNSSAITHAVPVTIASGDSVYVDVEFPIAGWS